MSLLLSLDLGTSKIALIAYDPTCRRIVSSVSAAVEAKMNSSPEFSLWDAQWFWKKVLKLLTELSSQIDVKSCLGLAVTGQQHGVVLLDRQSPVRPCSPFINWMDGRGCQKTFSKDRTLEEEIRERLSKVTNGELGCRMATGYAGLTLFDLFQKNQIPSNAVMSFLTDYINLCLCNSKHPVTDPSMAASSGLFDVRKQSWSEAALNALKLSRSLFPDLVLSGSLLGTLDSEVARITGLPDGLPVYQGIGDNQASILGSISSCSEINSTNVPVIINYGTGTQVTVLADSFLSADEFETRPFIDAQFLLVRAEPSGGRAYSLLKDFFQKTGQELFQLNLDENILFERMNRLAEEDVATQTICRPRFFPRRHSDGSEAQGSFSHLDAEHFTPGEFIRALLSGMAAESFEHWKVLTQIETNQSIERYKLIGSGNLFRKNPAFRTFVERRFGQPVHLSEIREEAAVGTALLMAKIL
ncbi:MAG: FGGY family carbohydrate kinase [Planctomycetia bacterium]|nr:FGGY family carbohydrate kinase [Planctomycetia bacterium]